MGLVQFTAETGIDPCLQDGSRPCTKTTAVSTRPYLSLAGVVDAQHDETAVEVGRIEHFTGGAL
jgi:hypothetical protein